MAGFTNAQEGYTLAWYFSNGSSSNCYMFNPGSGCNVGLATLTVPESGDPTGKVHPRTRKMLERYRIKLKNIEGLILLNPVGYLDSLWLAQNALFVLTDSGGLQEESTFFGTPCLTLRPNTERPITIEVGTNKLTDHFSLGSDIEDILQGHTPDGRIPKYWDGRSSDRILGLLLKS